MLKEALCFMLVITSLSETIHNKKNTSKTSQTHLRLEPDLAHLQDEMLPLAFFGALDNVRLLNKCKNVIPQTTLHSASQLLSRSGISNPLKTRSFMCLREQCPLERSPTPDVYCMHFPSQYSLVNRLGWTLIHRLQQFLSGLEVILIHRP